VVPCRPHRKRGLPLAFGASRSRQRIDLGGLGLERGISPWRQARAIDWSYEVWRNRRMTSHRNSISCLVLAIVSIGMRSEARADEFGEVEVAANIVVASENESAESAGYMGGQIVATRWEGPLGLAVEAGRHAWEWDGTVTWLGLGGRVALYAAERPCRKQDGSACAGDQKLKFRTWLELGAAREYWRIDDATFGLHASRNRYSVGIGADAGLTSFLGTFFFRLHRARPNQVMDRFGDMVDQTYETSLVFGAGFAFGI
jgi:hypothetical protein